ncbi:hypothetical protein V1478_011899 [Vespula squamosa]|uniref:Uncharacterized protein n=1 Tax=Vespula squamosa TaxID=30214 RepID=A0ABD2ABM8_VESSQ
MRGVECIGGQLRRGARRCAWFLTNRGLTSMYLSKDRGVPPSWKQLDAEASSDELESRKRVLESSPEDFTIVILHPR